MHLLKGEDLKILLKNHLEEIPEVVFVNSCYSEKIGQFFFNIGVKYVIVINAEKINLTGNKWTDKSYISHTGYPGGQRTLSANEMFDKDPARLVEKSVKGMLPKNKLGADLFRNLKVVVGAEHDHEAQKPKAINLNDVN